ncbi:hypothetical protein ACIO93_43120 [Streptomyces sp. NPDC087903]|uniref:hypothetical protein n=1 Tax=Streptomyces sp. NPDC087903 TaxID=3365819 RepID=UPI0038019E4A
MLLRLIATPQTPAGFVTAGLPLAAFTCIPGRREDEHWAGGKQRRGSARADQTW